MEVTQVSEETYLVDTAQAAKKLGVSRTYISALKKADFLDKNPNFRVRDYVGKENKQES